jgi:hypothetical protein
MSYSADLAKDRDKYRTRATQLARVLRDLVDGYDESNTRRRARKLLAEMEAEVDDAEEILKKGGIF